MPFRKKKAFFLKFKIIVRQNYIDKSSKLVIGTEFILVSLFYM